jgi:hypothetical protein
MTMVTSVATSAATATAEERLQVNALVRASETPTIPAYAAPRAKGLLLLAALLSADPDSEEPIEDAHGGVLQSLSCAQVF